MGNTVVVAMSGGVDSSVAAAILERQGWTVIGVGLQLVGDKGHEREARSCCGISDMKDARRVAERVGIPFYVLNFRDAFRENVIDYFTASYLRGETPNPCVPCNKVIKFDLLSRRAKELNAGWLATGHYAIVDQDGETGRRVLRKGKDESKDQSYFLYSLTQEQLARALFPVGQMTKADTREVAKSLGLKVHNKPESQDICFVGREGYAAFIRNSVGDFQPGPILDEEGSVLGTHRGLPCYTVGQRRGLGLSRRAPMYVTDIDFANNSITVAHRNRLRGQERVTLDEMNYVSIGRPSGPIEVGAVTRYRKPEVLSTLVPVEDGRAFLEFHEPQAPTAPGQSVVMYLGDMVCCGGIVARSG